MIRLVRSADRQELREQFHQMHILRKRVFADRMNWEVSCDGDQEVDRFDALDSLYILSETASGTVRGCLRLLPTTGPNMLADVFPQLLEDGYTVRSPLIWESSRFAVDLSPTADRTANGLNYATSELLCAIAEVGLAAGLQFIVSVSDVIMERVLKRAGCDIERICKPRRVGTAMTVAGFWEVSDQSLASVRDIAGIHHPVISASDESRINIAA